MTQTHGIKYCMVWKNFLSEWPQAQEMKGVRRGTEIERIMLSDIMRIVRFYVAFG
ncbi:uncharacterized protein Bfra_008155 [Botrytis fragariae]|uniref:Uncharacterized protein n=1 Tax=Botrytis fragariae TaxID=1964551 RepID=A0A8H6EHW2_9HELO|nr:uncharacterized protein Bfra_008155 [Botrytis fragariae]KAF5872879.1 hypothetical protein Bfra_008155 [Botrytis fragariae]